LMETYIIGGLRSNRETGSKVAAVVRKARQTSLRSRNKEPRSHLQVFNQSSGRLLSDAG